MDLFKICARELRQSLFAEAGTIRRRLEPSVLVQLDGEVVCVAQGGTWDTLARLVVPLWRCFSPDALCVVVESSYQDQAAHRRLAERLRQGVREPDSSMAMFLISVDAAGQPASILCPYELDATGELRWLPDVPWDTTVPGVPFLDLLTSLSQETCMADQPELLEVNACRRQRRFVAGCWVMQHLADQGYLVLDNFSNNAPEMASAMQKETVHGC